MFATILSPCWGESFRIEFPRRDSAIRRIVLAPSIASTVGGVFFLALSAAVDFIIVIQYSMSIELL
jgi:hypothetical protein